MNFLNYYKDSYKQLVHLVSEIQFKHGDTH